MYTLKRGFWHHESEREREREREILIHFQLWYTFPTPFGNSFTFTTHLCLTYSTNHDFPPTWPRDSSFLVWEHERRSYQATQGVVTRIHWFIHFEDSNLHLTLHTCTCLQTKINPHRISYLCSFTDHELLIQIRDSCVVTNEPFLYRL